MAKLADIIGSDIVVAKPRKKIAQRQLELRGRLWPDVKEDHLWLRKKRQGFTTIPRSMPLLLDIMDDLAKGQPVAMVYLELWCRAFDECFVTLSRSKEMAFHSGLSGQRGERTWRARMKILADLGFIKVQNGASGPLSYALIMNPYMVVSKLKDEKHPGLRADKFNELQARASEIGADDLDPVIEEQEEAIVQKSARSRKPRQKNVEKN